MRVLIRSIFSRGISKLMKVSVKVTCQKCFNSGMESHKGPGGPIPPPYFWLDISRCMVAPHHV